MQSVEVTIKGSTGEPMVLVFSATDAHDVVSERLRTMTWIARQIDGHGVEPRRRAARTDRAPAGTASETTTES